MAATQRTLLHAFSTFSLGGAQARFIQLANALSGEGFHHRIVAMDNCFDAAARLPSDVLYRPKMGFSVPLARWLRGPLAERAQSAIRGERIAGTGFFDVDVLQSMLDEHQQGRRDHAVPLWLTIMFDAFLAHAGEPNAPAAPAGVV